ncbi:MAG: phage tail protein [Chloroflexi bacterium]|nr:phage tail protein [Chloroflexota bacterium]
MATLHPDDMAVIKGFRIEITGAGGKEVDTAWETCTGGSLNIELADSSIGSDPAHISTPGHKFVEEIQLRGPMTSGRKWIAQNINDTVRGTFTRFDLTIVEIQKDGSDGKRFTYEKCFITRYVYPELSADGTGNLYEEVSIKPERLTLQ